MSPRTRRKGRGGSQCLQVSGVAASKGAHLEEDRGQAWHKHPFHGTKDTLGSPVWGLQDTLYHAPHSPLHTTSITSSELPGCVLGT